MSVAVVFHVNSRQLSLISVFRWYSSFGLVVIFYYSMDLSWFAFVMVFWKGWFVFLYCEGKRRYWNVINWDIYCPKILHEIGLPEIWLISTSVKWKCSKSAQYVIFYAVLDDFGTIWSTQRTLTVPKKYI